MTHKVHLQEPLIRLCGCVLCTGSSSDPCPEHPGAFPAFLLTGDPQQLNQLATGVKELLTSSTWEHKIGGLMAARVREAACTPADARSRSSPVQHVC